MVQGRARGQGGLVTYDDFCREVLEFWVLLGRRAFLLSAKRQRGAILGLTVAYLHMGATREDKKRAAAWVHVSLMELDYRKIRMEEKAYQEEFAL